MCVTVDAENGRLRSSPSTPVIYGGDIKFFSVKNSGSSGNTGSTVPPTGQSAALTSGSSSKIRFIRGISVRFSSEDWEHIERGLGGSSPPKTENT